MPISAASSACTSRFDLSFKESCRPLALSYVFFFFPGRCYLSVCNIISLVTSCVSPPPRGRGYSERSRRDVDSDKASPLLWLALLADGPHSAAEPTVLESAPKQTHVIAGSSWECTVAQCQPSSIYLKQLRAAGGLMLARLPPVSCWAPTGRWLRFPEASSLSPATKIITLEVCCRLQRAAVNHPAKYDLPVCANNGSCRQTTGREHFKSQTCGTRPRGPVTVVILTAPAASKVRVTRVFYHFFWAMNSYKSIPMSSHKRLSNDTSPG